MTPRVLVVSCGGTISSATRGAGGAATPSASAQDLVAGVPELVGLADITAVSHSLLPSSFETLADVLALRGRVETLVAQADARGIGYAGVVVTHGTDTMEEVAFALDLFWDRDLPLAVTGAMRHGGLPGADGPANLVAAVTVAVSATARGLGVLVVMNDVIHSPRLVRKTHTTNVAAFQSSSIGPLGFVAEGWATIPLALRHRPVLATVPDHVDAGSIALLTIGLGDDDRVLRSAAASDYAGVVIESMGGGHLPPAVVRSPHWAELVRRLPVVLASRAGSGPILHQTYDFEGSEIGLRLAGLIPSGILDGLKSRVLLAFLVGLCPDRQAIGRVFADIGHDGAVRGRPGAE